MWLKALIKAGFALALGVSVKFVGILNLKNHYILKDYIL